MLHGPVSGGAVGGAADAGIDGNCENSPFGRPRSVAIFANHSAHPNATLQYWPAVSRVSPAGSATLQQRLTQEGGSLWLVAAEELAAGQVRPSRGP
mmetsp:Transcript_6192/g.18522  ORF Transcript_6192/g.18522 Transcript_6192/m.18522 type:complete len:96 (-) Transcript_6192:746-1033(-)